jgi:hypothetical protein
MPRDGFEPEIAMIERETVFHALDHAATVIGIKLRNNNNNNNEPC